jgi:hypothetical protein
MTTVPRSIRPRRTDFNPVLAFKYETPGELLLTRGDRKPKTTDALYAYLVNLSRKTGHCDYDNGVLAEALEVSERTISRSLMWLKRRCYIEEGWVKMPNGWVGRWIYPTEMADAHLKVYREKMGLKNAILPVVRSSRQATKRSVPSDQMVVSLKGIYRGSCTEEERPQTPLRGDSESFTAGKSEPAAPPVMPVKSLEVPDNDCEDCDAEDGASAGQLRGEGWVTEIKEKHQGLANDLKAIFPDFDWENNHSMARKFVKALGRGALNARAVLLLKLYLRDAFEEGHEDTGWRKPQTFQQLSKRNVLDRTLHLCFEAAARDKEMGVGRLAQPGSGHYEMMMSTYRSYIRNVDFSDPEVWMSVGNYPMWVVAMGGCFQKRQYTLAQRQFIAERMLNTMYRSPINNVVELVHKSGRTVEEMFFISKHDLLEHQAQRQERDDAQEQISRIIFGEGGDR